MDYRRAALIEVFGNLPDTELRKLGHDLQAHHLNAMKSGKVVLLPTEIHKIVHDLTHLAKRKTPKRSRNARKRS